MFDPKKPVQMRNGEKVRIICTDKVSAVGLTMVVLSRHRDGSEAMGLRYGLGNMNEDGRPHPADLVNIPETRYEYGNVWCGEGVTTTRYKHISEARGAKGKTHGIVQYTFTDDRLTDVTLVE